MLAAAKIRVIWPDPAEPRATLVRVTPSGRERERRMGPRTLLPLDEAAAVLERSRADVLRSIRAGFLRPARRGSRRYVTMKACSDYVRDLLADLAVARERAGGRRIPAEESELSSAWPGPRTRSHWTCGAFGSCLASCPRWRYAIG